MASGQHRQAAKGRMTATREFIAKNGEFAVNIGLVEDGIPILGIVHGPAVGVTYVACGPGTAPR
jgi:3'(2'), 5'-bisphosphate nucleotidase